MKRPVLQSLSIQG